MLGDRTAAAVLLASRYPQAPHGTIIDAATAIAPDSSPTQLKAAIRHPIRANCIAVAYLLGASLGKLAFIEGVAKQTIYGIVARKLPDRITRNKYRNGHGRQLAPEGVSVVLNKLYAVAEKIALDAVDPYTLAKVMETEIEFDKID